jgi:hypothetical protein
VIAASECLAHPDLPEGARIGRAQFGESDGPGRGSVGTDLNAIPAFAVDRIEVLRDDGLPVRVIFDRVPPGLRARPTLSVNLDSSRAGTRPVSLRYLTSGLGWQADYVALYNEAGGTIDMQGWVTLTNNSGTTFVQADTVLVAGDPNGGGGNRNFGTRGMTRAGTEAAARERLGDFYLYPINARTTVANAQTKQVSFLDVQAVPARKVYSINIGWQQNDEQPRNVESRIAFSTSRTQGLGDALPAGTKSCAVSSANASMPAESMTSATCSPRLPARARRVRNPYSTNIANITSAPLGDVSNRNW